MKNVVFALLALAMVPSLAQAGGGSGNSKSDPKLILVNPSQTQSALVVVDAAQNPAAVNATTLAQFTNAGGVVLGPGESKGVKTKAGNHTIHTHLFTPPLTSVPPQSAFTLRNVTVVSGQDLTVQLP